MLGGDALQETERGSRCDKHPILEMSDFDSNGFLGRGIAQWTEAYSRKYAAWLSVSRDLNSFAQGVFHLCKVPSNDLQRLLSKTLFVRTLSNYQGAYLLCERGMEAETKILLRSMCEATFALVAVAKSAAFARRYIDHNEAQRLKDMNKLLSSPMGADADTLEKLKQQRDQLQARLRGIRTLRVEEIAKQANMYNFYCTTYAHFSLSVHATPQDMAQHLQTDAARAITHLIWGPTHKH